MRVSGKILHHIWNRVTANAHNVYEYIFEVSSDGKHKQMLEAKLPSPKTWLVFVRSQRHNTLQDLLYPH